MVVISIVLSAWIIKEFEKLVLRAAICTNVFKNTETQLHDWQAFSRQVFFGPKGSYEEF